MKFEIGQKVWLNLPSGWQQGKITDLENDWVGTVVLLAGKEFFFARGVLQRWQLEKKLFDELKTNYEDQTIIGFEKLSDDCIGIIFEEEQL